MMSEPLVSVLMTSYNRERYISFAIESVLSSTYKNFELIIVDDGSKDKTVAIIKEFATKDQRIKLFQNEVNLGDYPNRNKAASLASGKYIKYIDSDDLMYPWALSCMVSMMEQFPEAGWGLCSLPENAKRIFPIELTPREIYEYHYTIGGIFSRAPLSAIIKLSAFREAGYFKPIRMAGDFEMWQRLGQKYKLVLMPAGMVWYRRHDSQELNDYSQYITVYEELKVQYLKSPDCPLDREFAEALLKSEKSKIKNHIVKNLVAGDFKMMKMNIRNLNAYK